VRQILHLTLKREFFAAIAAGDKRTEYREQKCDQSDQAQRRLPFSKFGTMMK
jgi:hypothetical protein